MDLSLFYQKDIFPSFISHKLSNRIIDYKEKYGQIKLTGNTSSPQLCAGVALLLNYREDSVNKHEYVFQLIKRSSHVTQAGDISCPGGLLNPRTDRILSFFLAKKLIPEEYDNFFEKTDAETKYLVRLFLTNALREAWEEIGLNPFNTIFLGALPSYSLTLFARTIFPLVCLTRRSFEFKLSREVEKVLEIPIADFFDISNHALLEIETPFANSTASTGNHFPCFIFNDSRGNTEILWGATFNIIINFLNIISDNSFSLPSTTKIIKKILTSSYITKSR
jgi:8-oxo-dGTP pyrophosphatase MutT (NUDIX family)